MEKLRDEAGFTSWGDALVESKLKLEDTKSFENRLKILYALIPSGDAAILLGALAFFIASKKGAYSWGGTGTHPIDYPGGKFGGKNTPKVSNVKSSAFDCSNFVCHMINKTGEGINASKLKDYSYNPTDSMDGELLSHGFRKVSSDISYKCEIGDVVVANPPGGTTGPENSGHTAIVYSKSGMVAEFSKGGQTNNTISGSVGGIGSFAAYRIDPTAVKRNS